MASRARRWAAFSFTAGSWIEGGLAYARAHALIPDRRVFFGFVNCRASWGNGRDVRQRHVDLPGTPASRGARVRYCRSYRSCRPHNLIRPATYVCDLTHFLDDRGALGPDRGPARKLADFLAAVVAHATDFERPDEVPGPLCFKCRKRDARPVETMLTVDDFVVWRCLACGTEGQISNWQDSFWDLSAGRPDA